MHQSQPLRTAARKAHGLHGDLDGLMHSAHRHDESCNDDELDCTSIVDVRLLLGVEREAEIAVPEVFGVGKSRAENIGDNSRFDQQKIHVHSSQANGSLAGLDEPSAIVLCGCCTGEVHHGYSIVPTRQHLAQIAHEHSRDIIGQYEAIDNSALLAMRDPSDDADISIDDLNVGTSREGVLHDGGLAQRRGFIGLAHSNLHLQAGSPSRGAATSQSSAGIESGSANQLSHLLLTPSTAANSPADALAKTRLPGSQFAEVSA